MKERKEIQYISFLQLVGPFFVILGHSLNGVGLSEGLWWVFTKQWIYMFHMPLFFMISGYLLSYGKWMKGQSYGLFVKNKFFRLIFPYLVWNGICLIPKYFTQTFLSEEVEINISYLIKVFFSPRQNVWGHTWFLAGLFIIYLFTPVWEKVFSQFTVKKTLVFIIGGIILYIIPIRSELFCLSDLHKDILFFWMGCILGSISVEKLKLFFKKTLSFNILSAVISSVVCLTIIQNKELWFLPCSFILMSLLSIGLCLDGKISDTLIKYSRRSFGIYIMHWPVMVVIRVFFLQILEINAVYTVLLMIIGGFLIPNLVISILSKCNLGKFSRTMNYLLGV